MPTSGTLNGAEVAGINWRTVLGARRFVASASTDFECRTMTETHRGPDEVSALLAERRGEPSG